MASAQPETEIPFEDGLATLEEIVSRLEAGDMPLQETLELYEKGVAIARHCQELLDQAELRVTQLVEEEGETEEVPFDEDEE